MNWLAHFVLSNQDEKLELGNWLGDVVKGKDYKNYPSDIEKGILLHREIDSYTDGNEWILKCNDLFYPSQAKFAPVVVDVYLDYFLIQNWNAFVPVEFEPFKNRVYANLDNNIELFPHGLVRRTEALIHYDWFEKYRTLEGIQDVLAMMGSRVNYPNKMNETTAIVKENKALFNQYFLNFFPMIQEHCKNFIKYYEF